MAEIQGTGPISPRDRAQYEQEYRQGVNLFQNALNQCANAQNPYQQQQFDEVMSKALEVLNQTAQALKREDLLKQNNQIAKDLQAYQDNPTENAQNQLTQDLNQAKRNL